VRPSGVRGSPIEAAEQPGRYSSYNLRLYEAQEGARRPWWRRVFEG
jgi:hypothetical protein